MNLLSQVVQGKKRVCCLMKKNSNNKFTMRSNQIQIPLLHLESLTPKKKFQRTNRILHPNTSRSKNSISSSSSSKSFYIPHKNLPKKIQKMNLTQTIQASHLLHESQYSVASEHPLDLSQVSVYEKQEERKEKTQNLEDRKYLLQEIHWLKKQNQELKKKISALSETFDHHLKYCQGKNTNKMRFKIKEVRVHDLEEENKKLLTQVADLKSQVQQLKQTNQSTLSLSFSQIQPKQERISEQYVEQTERSMLALKEQNKNLKLQIDHLNRKFYLDVEMVRERKEGECKTLKGRLMEQIESNKKLGRENCQLHVKINSLEKQMSKFKSTKNSHNQIIIVKKTSNLLQLSSEQD